jgi:hypothetical protein
MRRPTANFHNSRGFQLYAEPAAQGLCENADRAPDLNAFDFSAVNALVDQAATCTENASRLLHAKGVASKRSFKVIIHVPDFRVRITA